MSKTKLTTIAEYIDSAPKEAQKNLREMYAILKKVASGATEGMKWGSPVFEEKRTPARLPAEVSMRRFL